MEAIPLQRAYDIDPEIFNMLPEDIKSLSLVDDFKNHTNLKSYESINNAFETMIQTVKDINTYFKCKDEIMQSTSNQFIDYLNIIRKVNYQINKDELVEVVHTCYKACMANNVIMDDAYIDYLNDLYSDHESYTTYKDIGTSLNQCVKICPNYNL